MSIELLTEHHLEFLDLTGGCTCSPQSALVKMPHCWKSRVTAQFIPNANLFEYGTHRRIGILLKHCAEIHLHAYEFWHYKSQQNIKLTICHYIFPSQRNISATYFYPNWALDVKSDASSGLACLAIPSYWYEYSLCY